MSATNGWDANKNKTSEEISGTMSGYGFAVGGSGYDDEDRLVNWERSDNNLDQAWNLSLVGDWNSITENASTQSRTHGPTHEMLTAAGASVSHDVKGNMTLIPAVLRPSSDPLTMSWDFDNRLVSADVDNDSTADVFYKWDALGRRVLRDDGTTASVFVQSGQQTIADYTAGTAASSPTYTYVYASYIDEPVMRGGSGGLRYYHRNQQYSVIALTSGSGAITERYAYTAYVTPIFLNSAGVTLPTSNFSIRHTYTGREWDSSLSLYHYRARMYDAVAGRFCARDPIGFEGSLWNLVEYCGSKPYTFNDWSGSEVMIFTLPNPENPLCGLICDEYRNQPGADLHGIGGVVCKSGIKCSCVFGGGQTGFRPGQCPELDDIIKNHEDKHHKDVDCPEGTRCERPPFRVQDPEFIKQVECQHRQDSLDEMIELRDDMIQNGGDFICLIIVNQKIHDTETLMAQMGCD